jgi:hypothetical protein
VLLEDSTHFTSQKNSVLCKPSGCPTKASSVRTTRTFNPDLPLYREASNCSSLHPSGRFSSTSGRHSVFDQRWDFLTKHSYRKIATTVRTTWIPVLTGSFIRQVSYSKSRRLDDSPLGPDVRAYDMEIVCIRSTVQTTIPLVRTREALIWKLLAAEVRSSEQQGTTVQMWLKTGKNFSEIFGKPITQLSVRTPYDYRPDSA